VAKCSSIDPYLEVLAADLDAAKGALTGLHEALYVEPCPDPHAVARALVEIAEVRTKVAALAALIEGGRS
jgi:hypothetical protein